MYNDVVVVKWSLAESLQDKLKANTLSQILCLTSPEKFSKLGPPTTIVSYYSCGLIYPRIVVGIEHFVRSVSVVLVSISIYH